LTPGRNTDPPTRAAGEIVVGVTASVGVLDGNVVGGAVVVELDDRDDLDAVVFVDARRLGDEQAVAPSVAMVATSAPHTTALMRRFRRFPRFR
jgi:hypothetical protein